MKCPCCGQTVAPPNGIMVNLERNEIAVGWIDTVVKLSPRQAEVAAVLLRAMPRTVPTIRLISGVFGVMEPDSADNNLRVHIKNLRKRIAPLGLKISTLHLEGYRMEKDSVENSGEPADTRRVDGLPEVPTVLLGASGNNGKSPQRRPVCRLPADKSEFAISQG